MRRYSTIPADLLARLDHCSPTARIVAMGIRCCDAANMAGVFRLRAGHLAVDLGLTREQLDGALGELEEHGEIKRSGLWLWIVDAAGFELRTEKISQRDNRWKPLREILREAPDDIAEEWLEKYAKKDEDGEGPTEGPSVGPSVGALEGVPKGHRKPGTGTEAVARQEPPRSPPAFGGADREESPDRGAPRKARRKGKAVKSASPEPPPEPPPELLAALPDFPALWADRKKARGKKMTPTSERTQFNQLLGWLKSHGPDVVRQSIEEATASGWQGVWEPKTRNGNGSGSLSFRERDAVAEHDRLTAALRSGTAAPDLDIPARLRDLAAAVPDDWPDRSWLVGEITSLTGEAPAVEEGLERVQAEALRRRRKALGDEEKATIKADVEAAMQNLARRLPKDQAQEQRQQIGWQLLRRRTCLPELTLFGDAVGEDYRAARAAGGA